jgi:hypothetical protein
MKKQFVKSLLFTVCMVWAFEKVEAQKGAAITVKANQIKGEIQPTMWGVFFEDINLGADGGIYAELVKNRSFEFFKPLMGWTVQGKQVKEGAILVLNRKEKNTANPPLYKSYLQQTRQKATWA